MDDTADTREVRRRGRRALGEQPGISVASRPELARVLREHRPTLVDIARALVHAEHVDEVLRLALSRLLSTADARVDDVLGEAARFIEEEAQRLGLRRGEGAGESRGDVAPLDPMIRDLAPEAEVRAAVRKLSPAERRASELAGEDLQPADIALTLGISNRAATMRLYRARQHVRQWLDKGKQPAFVLAAARRFRGSGARFLPPLRVLSPAPWMEFPPQLAVPLILAATIGWAARPIVPSERPYPTTTATLWAPAAQAHTEMGTSRLSADAGTGSFTSLQPESVTATGLVARLPDIPMQGRLPSQETPNDSRMISVTPSPHYQDDHTIVALGLGNSCACPVLFRSTDGGADWSATLQAAIGSQVMLPPDYPADPRIFIGQDPGAARPAWVSAGWGQPFAPVPIPPGRLGMAGSQIISASRGAVWSLRGAVLSPIASYQGTLAAALTGSPEGVFILVPANTIVPGHAPQPTPSLLACTPDCSLLGPVPVPGVGQIAVRDQTIVATAQGHLVMSRNAGRSFADVTPPGWSGDPQSLATDGTALWAVVGAQATRLLRLDGGWTTISVPAPSSVRAVATVTSSRVLALLADGDIRCSVDSGRDWTANCPVDS
jgi:DNA-directed RNA polymerase specialized sigma24 family protein